MVEVEFKAIAHCRDCHELCEPCAELYCGLWRLWYRCPGCGLVLQHTRPLWPFTLLSLLSARPADLAAKGFTIV